MHRIGVSGPAPAVLLRKKPAEGVQQGRGVSTRCLYELRDPEGNVVAYHGRRDFADGSKNFWWQSPDGKAKLSVKSAELPLYGCEHLAAVEPDAPVVVVEGEKAQEALHRLGITAVGTVTGAAVTPSADVLRVLVGRPVLLWPDNDEKGRAHMAAIAKRLRVLGVEPAWVTWPDAPEKGDAADLAETGGKEAVEELLRGAVRVEDAGLLSEAPHTNGVVPNGATTMSPGLVVHCMANLTSEEVRWLWRGRIPLGKITVLDGDPGLGKSTVTLDIAVRLTLGKPMPDGVYGDLEGPASVLLLTAEDGLRDTVLPRLEAVGADRERVFALESVPDAEGKPGMPAIPRDLEVIERMIVEHDVKLIIVDPLIAFLGDSQETNTWRDQDIRRALGPFAQMLERTGCASLLVRHLNKGSGGNPIYRGGGSIGIIGAARSGLLVQKDPDDDTGVRRVMAPTKANLSAPAKAMAYHMEQAVNGSVMVVWEGETEHTAVGLLADPLPEEERGALADAITFLRAELYGKPVEVKELNQRARSAGHSLRSIERARKKLGVKATKEQWPNAPWFLSLPVVYLKKEPTT